MIAKRRLAPGQAILVCIQALCDLLVECSAQPHPERERSLLWCLPGPPRDV